MLFIFFCMFVKIYSKKRNAMILKNKFLSLATILLSITIITVACGKVKNETNDLATYQLTGNVKSVKQTSTQIPDETGKFHNDSSDIDTNSENDFYLVFDKSGKLIEEKMMSVGDSLLAKITYAYDREGKRTERNWYNAKDSLMYHFSYKYDEKGNRTEHTVYLPDSTQFMKFTYQYDDKGNRTEISEYNASACLVWNATFKYDEKSKLIENYYYKPDASNFVKIDFTYDEKGNISEEKRYTSIGTKTDIWRFTYKLDNKGNWVEKIKLVNGKEVKKFVRAIEYF